MQFTGRLATRVSIGKGALYSPRHIERHERYQAGIGNH